MSKKRKTFKKFPTNLIIRAGALLNPDLGFLVTGDIKREEDDEDRHAVIIKWKLGDFSKTEAEFEVSSCCFIRHPEIACIKISNTGVYGLQLADRIVVSDVCNDDVIKDKTERGYTAVSKVCEIAGMAYVVGINGTVLRMEGIKKWTCIDQGLPLDFEIQCIHGFSANDIYAVGYYGQVWRYDGKKWHRIDVPTNVHLEAVKCAGDGQVYIGARNRILLRGRNEQWEIIGESVSGEDIWGIDWFGGSIYVSTFQNFYHIMQDKLEPVDFGVDKPKTTYRISTAPSIMWSIGEKDVMSFDGKAWRRIV